MKCVGTAIVIFALLDAHAVRADDDDATCRASYVAGQRLYKLQHDDLAGRAEFLVCAKTCPDELRASCGKWLREIEAELPSVVVRAKDARGHDVLDVQIVVDEKPIADYVEGSPIELNPGPHVVRVVRANHAPVEQSLVLHASEKLRVVDLWTEPQLREVDVVRTRSPIPLGTFVLGGIGAAALASFGVFSIWSTVEYANAGDCAPNCALDSRDTSFRTKTIVADVSLGIGAAALIAAAVVYLSRPTFTERDRQRVGNR